MRTFLIALIFLPIVLLGSVFAWVAGSQPEPTQTRIQLPAAELATKVIAARGTVYVCKACGKAASENRPKVCVVCKAGPESFEAIRSSDIEAAARREGGLTEESAFDGAKLNWTQDARGEFARLEAGHAKSRIQAEIEKTARVKGLSVVTWNREALSRLARVPAGFMRERTRRSIEEYAGGKGKKTIDLDTAEAGLAEARKTMQEMMSKGRGIET